MRRDRSHLDYTLSETWDTVLRSRLYRFDKNPLLLRIVLGRPTVAKVIRPETTASRYRQTKPARSDDNGRFCYGFGAAHASAAATALWYCASAESPA